MSTTEFMSDFQQLLPKEEFLMPVNMADPGNTQLFVVLKNYKFHKQLCIELYRAETTQNGKIKNPLTHINPLDLIWRTKDIQEVKFFSAITRFQNNPTTTRSATDTEALKTIVKNPLQLPFYYHNPEFSENIVAGSIERLSWAARFRSCRCGYNAKKLFMK